MWRSSEHTSGRYDTTLTRSHSVVFIHGLTGGRESTWTAKGAATSWPESFLTKDLLDARIILYGYDADVVNFWSMASQNATGDHGQKFLCSLANLRDATGTVSPITNYPCDRKVIELTILEHEAARIRCT